MKILAIESSGATAAAALTEGEMVLAEYEVCHNKTHSVMLLPIIDDLLKRTDNTIADVDAIAVSEGPGSFTGLRIGVAMAKSLAMAADKPLVGVSTLEALACNVRGCGCVIAVVMDARREQVYTALYRDAQDGLEVLCKPEAKDISEVVDEVNALGERTVFVGDGTGRYGAQIAERCRVSYRIAPPQNNRQRASSVAFLGAAALSAKVPEPADADDFAPVYLRPSQAERVRSEQGKDRTDRQDAP